MDNNKDRVERGNDRSQRPIEVAIVGGGCAGLTAAFELTRPELGGKYHVTVYQLGWRLGGKGASGRGLANRIEEHGLHVWLGFYENAFRIMRDCYSELERDPRKCPISKWEDAFIQGSFVGVADKGASGEWLQWTTLFPAMPGLPGDRLDTDNPFTIKGYVTRTAALLRTLVAGVATRRKETQLEQPTDRGADTDAGSVEAILRRSKRLLKFGVLGTAAGLAQAAAMLEVIMQSFPSFPQKHVLEVLRVITHASRSRLEKFAHDDDETRYVWEIIDLVVAILTGIVRFGIATDPRGFDAINDYECREWLKVNGASDASLDSAFVRGLFDLAMAYPGGDVNRPALAAGQAIRGALRMFFTYRGALFWKMRGGMGDIVFAPLYEVLKKRGVSFEFFHRLENVGMSDPNGLAPGEHQYVKTLEFDVQAQIDTPRDSSSESGAASDYKPLVDVNGLPCWPAAPDYTQLVDGESMRTACRDFESFWDRGKEHSKTLCVGRHFDFVVLAIGVGAVPHVCRELVDRDVRWRDMVKHVRSVPTQAFQIWLRESMNDLGWSLPAVSLSAFARPFDTWADMSHLVPCENWHTPPASIAYFCSVLSDPQEPPERDDADYPLRRRAEVRANAIEFLNRHVGGLWPKAVDATQTFRWDLLVDPEEGNAPDGRGNESRFDSQFWTANVNPSDRYVLAPPGSLQYRISPLDNTYDNLTIAGDWTACGFTEGCVEAAVMSGRLAAHAIAKSPPLRDIIGYDHP